MKNFLELMEENERTMLATCDQQARALPQFNKKLKTLIKLITNESGYSQRKRAAMLEEAAGTSDFSLLFGTVLERTLLAQYSIANPDWRSYIKTGTQNDFRPADAIGVYGLQGGLSEVKQRDEYKQDAQLGEGKISISLKKYGRAFGLGWEAIINDDLGALSDIGGKLSTAALRTEYREATKLFAGTAAPNASLFLTAGKHPIDGATITNKGALPLTADNLGTTLAAMRNQKDADNEPIIIEGFHVVVPPALELTLRKILAPGALLMSGGDGSANAKGQITTSQNVLVQQFNITPHVNPYLPIITTTKGDSTWYVFADLASGYAAKLNFLRGHETPELVMKAPNKVALAGQAVNPFDGNFEEDSIWWRVRHILGGTQFDPRMAYAQVG